ncbi:hypothetical protein IA01_00815 [Flavobacterium psychrophilum]|nr:hypothetical protein IA01_00815 [Flavobacterium psychrophilum]
MTAIGEDAFAGCRSLKTVNCHITSPLVINANVFGNITQSNCALNVPTGTQVAYQAAAVWRNFRNKRFKLCKRKLLCRSNDKPR